MIGDIGDVIIREPKVNDASALLEYYNELINERTYILHNKKFTLSEEVL